MLRFSVHTNNKLVFNGLCSGVIWNRAGDALVKYGHRNTKLCLDCSSNSFSKTRVMKATRRQRKKVWNFITTLHGTLDKYMVKYNWSQDLNFV